VRRQRRPPIVGLAEAPSLIAIGTAIAVIVSVFLPWFRTNLGAPSEPGRMSGWAASSVGKGAVFVAALWLLAAALSFMEQVSPGRIDRATVNLLGWLVMLCAAVTFVLVSLRLVRPPHPAEFLSRDYGLFIAVAASLIGLGAGMAMTRGNRPRTRASARRRAVRGV